MIIRQVIEKDAGELLRLLQTIDGETPFMLYEEGERKTTEEEQREKIHKLIQSDNSNLFVADCGDGTLAGYLTAVGGEANRNRHSVYIVIGIKRSHTGQGIGTKLFLALEEWARSIGITRLSLGLMEQNHAALALYTKMGFELEGRKKQVFLVVEQFVDELIMGKLLT